VFIAFLHLKYSQLLGHQTHSRPQNHCLKECLDFHLPIKCLPILAYLVNFLSFELLQLFLFPQFPPQPSFFFLFYSSSFLEKTIPFFSLPLSVYPALGIFFLRFTL